MRKLKEFGQFLLGLALFAGALWIGWVVVGTVVRAFLSLKADQFNTVVAASATLLVAVVTVVLTNRGNKIRELAEAHRPQKVAIYDDFMGMMIEILKSAKEGKTIDVETAPSDFMDRWFEFKRGMIEWGSPKVIKTYTEFENSSVSNRSQGLNALDEVLREIRKDLGHSNRGLPKGSLIGMFLTPEARQELGLSKKAT